jgi:hypothetical protein
MVRLQVSNHKNSSTLDPTQSGVMHIKIDGQVAQMTPPPQSDHAGSIPVTN